MSSWNDYGAPQPLLFQAKNAQISEKLMGTVTQEGALSHRLPALPIPEILGFLIS